VRLEVSARGGSVVVHMGRDHGDALLSLDVENRGTRTVVVDSVTAVYLAAGRTVRADRLDPALFEIAAAERKRKIHAGSSTEWAGVCLERVPREADRVRLDLALSSRAGLSRQRAVEQVEIELRQSPPPVVLRIPFEGYWLVTQGHSCTTNHRVGGFGSDYAWDFVHFSPTGRTVRETYEATGRNEDSYSFGFQVFAPVDGTVVRVVGDVPDNEGLKDYPRRTLLEDLEQPEWIFGNTVVIDAGNGVFVMLAHLQRGSVAVKPGDSVRAGDPIAKCGNSGNTVRPHLHLQVMDRPDPAESSVHGLPASFSSYRVITYTGDATHKDILARVVVNGDPQEGSIIVPVSQDDAKP
jgi:hypothetical protein